MDETLWDWGVVSLLSTEMCMLQRESVNEAAEVALAVIWTQAGAGE